ncbi:MAG: methylenetetrahydrofolate reductase [NAD(P)H] [Nitrospina sp.]|jgi:methylenetetrahydrofolate reductase (NADPH)|nr:methylenetetrahydrofolate reductase [NAD(P)H] [Nitrospina sp.]MBT3414303.1 methylenetetrahydrofolate reductase [NAD(P)H] [Nitrospina sp.]MBT3856667.1 methylenetetrahydrofolate reductase [NAD(P)H] [Nitrospina sp.]MBT4105284.1 methylenetetrahydrofolate reductase [NAD(P)H] [Nitrospina sp.]MBT4390785.1 methylenetetrahydrofolate reductase [NAD(P)H] [Nitrospina sp.]
MKIIEKLNDAAPIFSFEFFPPKDSEGFATLYETIARLKPSVPAYVSVTYGAGGSTRAKTVDLVGKIKNAIGIESMAHLTCVGHDQQEIRSVLESLQAQDIENVLALRGDPPQGEETFVKTEGGFEYASELVAFIKNNFTFCIGAACYPEGHVECPDLDKDIENLQRKVDSGVDFLITQLFFDNRYYFDFLDRAQKKNINVPVVPGIMPILNLKQIKRFTKMCGAHLSDELLAKFEDVQDDNEKVRQIGIRHAISQCRELLENKAPGIHFYTLNRSKATLAILEELKDFA